MQAVLLIDFGSTYTKLTAVDVTSCTLLGTSQSHTTVETDINDGLDVALAELERITGKITYSQRLACSSAAGGLRMVTSGLVPALTAEAARLASLGAGAKVVKTFAYQLTDEDIAEIAQLKPDIFLLTGGTDGGDTACILHNAEMLATCPAEFPILLAGNRSCAAQCMQLLKGREVYRCENVMPRLDVLHIEPVQEQIRELFLRRIIQAKGLSKAKELVSGILMPTPSAMLQAMKLLAGGTPAQRGLGELVAVDIGGATTDVYSIATGAPQNDSTILRGLPEPYAKRTVEGDIGMRYGAAGILEAVGAQQLADRSGLDVATVPAMVERIAATPDFIPDSADYIALDAALAAAAAETAVTRHAGTLEQAFTPTGPVFVQTGKDLTRVGQVVVTGGAVSHNPHSEQLAVNILYHPSNPYSLRPKAADILIDRRYILSAMGLLGEHHPDCALTMMKKELECHGAHEQTHP